MYENLDHIEGKYRISSFPLNLIIEPGNYCNLNCITCAQDRLTRPKGSMDIRLYKKIIDEVSRENPYTRIWLDFYGEPLLQRHKIYYMIQYAEKMGIKNKALNTNGTLLDFEMGEMLLDSGIDFISIDCDGFSKEVYEKIRVNGDRDVTYRNIERFIERKRVRKLIKPVVEIKTMEMEENKDEIDKIMNHFRQLGGVLTTRRRLISWAGQVGTIVPKTPHDRIACGNAVGTMAITWDGVVTNCVMDVDAKYPCGDIKQESIKTIWKRRNEHMVSRHLEHRWKDLPSICQDCMDWAIIGEERFDENGIPMNKNYDCEGIMIE